MKVYSIGFTRKTAEEFFTILRQRGIRRLIDVRLNNVSQLAGFSKRDDLRFFLREICQADYVQEPLLAPTQEILDRYRKNNADWQVWEHDFVSLIRARQIEKRIDRRLLDEGVLLCSEAEPRHCHRRLVLEYFQKYWDDLEIIHL